MVSFKKPTAALRLPRLTGEGKERHTNHMALLGLGVTIAYKKRPVGTTYPSDAQKAKILASAKLARNVVRVANDELAKVVILRKKEPQNFIDTMATHFGLVHGDTAGGYLKDNVIDKKFKISAILERDRRWVLNKIRESMLSLSFHLNTGMYLIDQDAGLRDIEDGVSGKQGEFSVGDEAYVMVRGSNSLKHLCGFRNGEIHVDFQFLEGYSDLSYSRIIIHEAAHKYLAADDIKYAHNANYFHLNLKERLNNADCYAWAAVSLYSGAVKMANAASGDWENA